MKIAYGSDFHFEFYKTINDARNIIESWIFEPDTDMIVIAGDLHVGAKKVFTLLEFISEMHSIPIVYVPGNHEYYRSSFKKENANFYRKGITNEGKYYILLRNSVEFSNIGFYGCLGNIDGSWEDIEIWKHGALNDFHMIKDFFEHKNYGRGERKFMMRNIDPDKISIAVTHTMPSPRCIDPKYKGDNLNPCFANDWEKIIYSQRPAFWICGHTHSEIDMKIDNTHVVANPYGYPHENMDWDWKYINIKV